MSLDIVVTRFVQQNVGGLRRDLTTLGADFLILESRMASVGNTAGRAAALGTVGIAAISTIVSKSLQAYGQVQRVETGYMTVLRSASKVRELSNQVRDFDVKTPFSYLDSARASQMLLAAGFRSDLMPTMYAVGNAVIAAGKGTDTFTRALSIMSKIKTSGVLTAVRVNQFAAAGINIKDILKKQLDLTDEQMINIGRLHLKADVVIPALIKGMNEQFGGAIEKAKNTYLGSLEIMKGSTEKMFAQIGKTIEKDATGAVHSITKLTTAISDFVKFHPRVTRMVLAIGAIGSTAAVIYGVVKAIQFATLAKKALIVATKADTVAEGVKAGVAVKEGAAITGVGAAATKTGAKVAGMAAGAGAAGTKMSVFEKIWRFFRSPDKISGANSFFEPKNPFYSYVNKKGITQWKDSRTNKFVGKAIMEAWEAERDAARAAATNFMGVSAKSPAARMAGRFMQWGNAPIAKSGLGPTAFGAIGGLLDGISAGFGIRDDLLTTKRVSLMPFGNNNAGFDVSEGQANTIAATAGIATAVASMFIPGAAIPIAIATGFRFVFNELVNVPMEKAATEGNGLSDETVKGSLGDRKKQADNLFELANKKYAEAEAINPLFDFGSRQAELRMEGETFRRQAVTMTRGNRKLDKEAAEKRQSDLEDEQRKQQNLKAKLDYDEMRARTYDPAALAPERRDDDYGGWEGVNGRTMGSKRRRDGVDLVNVQVQIPNRPADTQSRTRGYKASTPPPNYT